MRVTTQEQHGGFPVVERRAEQSELVRRLAEGEYLVFLFEVVINGCVRRLSDPCLDAEMFANLSNRVQVEIEKIQVVMAHDALKQGQGFFKVGASLIRVGELLE